MTRALIVAILFLALPALVYGQPRPNKPSEKKKRPLTFVLVKVGPGERLSVAPSFSAAWENEVRVFVHKTDYEVARWSNRALPPSRRAHGSLDEDTISALCRPGR